MASQDWFDKDFYKVLGVSKDVSAADLKKTYRKLARQYHPDSNAGDAKAEARFKEISEAYAVLSDPGEASIRLRDIGVVFARTYSLDLPNHHYLSELYRLKGAFPLTAYQLSAYA